ncbi:calponin homology domain-containing protein [Mycotypha africana]|uniref:calponin domain-containing protein n=1 Tax=Mycotypha africana TaxID=64632 RepID=UPI002301AE9F|nr:calponin domain-containing protein [Mycotypha africana]KAI8969218.1 calponin homology domain-containing protein [Mycotypha africana]
MGESRTELLAWLNDLLQTRYTKVEQAGTGGAYCQIFDSIYGDVPMSKVKFDAKLEYEFINNFKILQNALKKHKVDKNVPVDRLIKCKLQDNLEFMQWVKRYWEQNYPGGEYDALGRRKGTVPTVASSTRTTTTTTSSSPGSVVSSSVGGGRASSTNRKATKTPASRSGSRGGGGRTSVLDNHSASMIIDLNKQITELKLAVDGLEKERDFYFGKLREIEIEVQENLEQIEVATAENEQPPEEHEAYAILRNIQNILYSTEDGFEVPPEEEEDILAGTTQQAPGRAEREEEQLLHHQPAVNALEYDDETF